MFRLTPGSSSSDQGARNSPARCDTVYGMKKIIVAHDLRTMFIGGNSALSRDDVRIFTAPSAKEILKIHGKERVDLIIVDLDMQGMAGDELCNTIRGDDDLKTVALILACPGEKSAVERCRVCGANAVITKPINQEELFHTVIELLNISERGNLRGLIKVSVHGRFRNDFFFSTSHNISTTGMLIETDRVLAHGDKITCSLVLQHNVTITGEIRRVTKKASDLYDYGIRFLDLDPKSKAQIEEFIKSLKRS
jgi:DNA-binding response OmpR family regulator